MKSETRIPKPEGSPNSEFSNASKLDHACNLLMQVHEKVAIGCNLWSGQPFWPRYSAHPPASGVRPSDFLRVSEFSLPSGFELRISDL